MAQYWSRIWLFGRTAFLTAFVVVTGVAAFWLATRLPAKNHAAEPSASGEAKDSDPPRRRLDQDTLLLSAEVVKQVGVRTGKVELATKKRTLTLQGVLALDPNQLSRVHSPFAGEIIKVGKPQPKNPGDSGLKINDTFRRGDEVHEGDVLAVIWNKDLGEKKSELVDALSKLRSDERTLRNLEKLFAEQGGTSERNLRDQERVVEASRIAVAKAVRTLKSWRLETADIDALAAEANSLNKPGVDVLGSELANWASVEIKAKQAGIILEKNVKSGDTVDTAIDLFKIGVVSELDVWAHVYEDDLPLLQAEEKPVKWTVTPLSRPDLQLAGTLEEISDVIDPNQHTALVRGRVPNGDRSLKVGQPVTVSVNVKAEKGLLEVPAEAVVEDGRESVVMVRPSEKDNRFIRKSVQVVRRFRDVIYVRHEANGLQPDERVVTNGALLLRDSLEDLPIPSEER